MVLHRSQGRIMMDEHFHYKCDVVTCTLHMWFQRPDHKTFLIQFPHVFNADHLWSDHGKCISGANRAHLSWHATAEKSKTKNTSIFDVYIQYMCSASSGPIDFSQIIRHFEFNVDVNKASTVTRSSITLCSEQLSKLLCIFFSTVFFLRKMFHQMNNLYVAKQQYNPLNVMYFYPSQPCFFSCQKLKISLPWLRSITFTVTDCLCLL